MDIKGRNALVTGAGQGIGEACALMLADNGADTVVIVDINQENLDKVAAEIRSRGSKAITKTCDVSQPDNVIQMLREAEDETGGLDIIHNNAGINNRKQPQQQPG